MPEVLSDAAAALRWHTAYTLIEAAFAHLERLPSITDEKQREEVMKHMSDLRRRARESALAAQQHFTGAPCTTPSP